MKRAVFAGVLILSLLVPLQAAAQAVNAVLGGTISDPSGGLIPGATVSAANTQTGVVASAVSNESGAYNFPSLQPGIYRVTASLPGFQTYSFNNLELGATEQKRLNFVLQVAAVSTAVEVSADASQLLTATGASVGEVLTESAVRDLPLPGRDVLDLIGIMAGVSGEGATASFAGGRANSIATTRDGVNVGNFRYENGVYSVTAINPDLVGEVRIILAPADAETGRGSGQVQIQTRSGTNRYSGSLNWNVRNSAFNANTWANNLTTPVTIPNWSNQHQITASYGGPIVRNKTFFFGLLDLQRSYSRSTQSVTVLTDSARKGIFRFFPGVNNGNTNTNVNTGAATAAAPTVDFLGNPVKPVIPGIAVGDLQSVNVFGVDPVRSSMDPTGFVQKVLDRMPQPNAYDGGDGLNTAVFRWVRRTRGTDTFAGNSDTTNRNQFNLKIDQNFNARQKLSVNYTVETDLSDQSQSTWPGGYDGEVNRKPQVITARWTSTLASTLLNEFLFGLNRVDNHSSYAMDNRETGAAASEWLPLYNGIPVMIHPVLASSHVLNCPRFGCQSSANLTNAWTYSDSLSWSKAKHGFKGGFELRLNHTNGWNSEIIIPHATGGAGNPAIQNVDGVSFPGLLATNQTRMRDLISTLSGSISQIEQAFSINDPRATEFSDYRDIYHKTRIYEAHEWSAYFKDDWKVRRDLTLNLGVRYEFYGVPYEAQGLTGALEGGSASAFGISGRDFSAWRTFGPPKADLTKVQFVGPNSPNPDLQIYKDDRNNFGPAVGFSWNLPWFGDGRTVVRGGYGIAYQGGGRALVLDRAVGQMPGISQFVTYTSAGYMNLANLPIPVPHAAPLRISPTTERTQVLEVYDSNTVSPYTQNLNFSVTRTLNNLMTLDLRYVGTRARKQFGIIPINAPNYQTNGLLEAFIDVREGRDSALLDDMLRGLQIQNGMGAINGTTVHAAPQLRANNNWRTFFANGNVSGFVSRLNSSVELTNEVGGLLRRNGYPENFVVANPQFDSVQLRSNPGSSAYDSLQAELTMRPIHGLSYQGTYVWSKSMGNTGNSDSDATWIDPADRRLDWTLQGSHRTHQFRSNGTFELPAGPNKLLFGNSSGILARAVERWQLSWIFNLSSGAPLSITSQNTSIGGGFPDIVGSFAKDAGSAVKLANRAAYFDAGRYSLVPDPSCAAVTALQSLNQQCTLTAVADADGRLLLVNSQPGRVGTLGQNWLEGPGSFRLDVAARKNISLSDSKTFQLRVDATNLLNHPILGNPNLNINSTNFGQITTASGSRTFAASARLTF